MNVIMLIPTGIGCAIGGHAGDANPVARLLAGVCDNLLLHPNVVNASDLNEMPDNSWYVEGSMLDRFLDNEFNLHKPKSNRILVVSNDCLEPATRNSIEASMYTLGTNIKSFSLKTPLEMRGTITNEKASGNMKGVDELIEQVLASGVEFDALAIHSKVLVDDKTAKDYLMCGGINPYGAIEAKVSKYISKILNKPVAHAPVEELVEPYNGLSYNPRMSASIISSCYLNSVLKGLHKAPRIVSTSKLNSLNVDDIDCLVTPINCYGTPHKLCIKRGIPIIAVRENTTTLKIEEVTGFNEVSNYLEAAGMITAINQGLNLQSLTTKNLSLIEFYKTNKDNGHGCSC